jgi:hypothetical protein
VDRHKGKGFIHRTEFVAGGIVGAILTLAVAGTLDLFFPETGGGWSETIRQSVLAHLGHPWEENFLVRLAFGITAFALMTAVGALLGAFFSLLLSGFFRKLRLLLDRHDGG